MEEEILRLRELIARVGRAREEAEKKWEDEHRRRVSAQTLAQYLEACHSLGLAIRVEANQSSTTQGGTTGPTRRIFPRRIIPWDEYPAQQESIWGLLDDLPFCSKAVFPTSHQLDYVASLNKPITSEAGLRNFARDTIENAVQKLFDAALDDEQLRARLRLQGSVTFEDHTNFGVNVDDISASVEQSAVARDGTDATTPALRRPRKAKKAMSGSADQSCICRKFNGRSIPALAIEYKAPHKLTRDEIVTGLQGEIQPARDVISQDGKGSTLASKALVAAVITQLFSYMVAKGIQYGYVCTGETLVFLFIPEDPSVVYYYVCVPNVDVLEDDEDRLHHTAVAQIFAFVLQALCSPAPPQTWHDRAESLDTWAVEFEDVLRSIPETHRKSPKKSPPYKTQRWRRFERSPIKIRSRRRPGDRSPRCQGEDDGDGENDLPSPFATQSLHSSTKATAVQSAKRDCCGAGGGRGGIGDTTKGQTQITTRVRIQDRPFCTQKCLLGLVNGGPLDSQCPNYKDHQRQHLSVSEFQRLVRLQLANDRGPDADAMPLYLSGSIGALFKVCLSSHGYTLVAKGVEEDRLDRLRHESQVYGQLRTIQGQHVPVCLGIVDLILPYYYDSGVFYHFLFLSWAGRPLFDAARQTDKEVIISAVREAFQAIHTAKVLHCDAEPRNVLYDTHTSRIMVVDFERAKLISEVPLRTISPKRERKHVIYPGQDKGDDFTEELSSVISRIQRNIR
ncbi:hypothetical protein F5X97DRAFT_247716 [Nemania serpens]|nr:hypothetical protein F5X97DRAFT_247716 [Nemania serpens]